jgi:hypothetical protein
MKTVKFTQAKTEVLKQAVNLIDMYKFKSSLSSIKKQAVIAGADGVAKAKTFKSAYAEMVVFYNQALAAEESESLAII